MKKRKSTQASPRNPMGLKMMPMSTNLWCRLNCKKRRPKQILKMGIVRITRSKLVYTKLMTTILSLKIKTTILLTRNRALARLPRQKIRKKTRKATVLVRAMTSRRRMKSLRMNQPLPSLRFLQKGDLTDIMRSWVEEHTRSYTEESIQKLEERLPGMSSI